MSGIGEAMMITWAGFGLRIEGQNESDESLEIYISVPESSYHFNKNQEEMAGMLLAKRFKQVLTEMGVKRLTVKVRVRRGERWTKEMQEDAELNMRKELYGSQY